MTQPTPFGAHSTADRVLAGIDLSGKTIVVTGCSSGIGFQTMSALCANGAEVIGLARSPASAADACALAGPGCVPLGCDLEDLDSVDLAAAAVRARTGRIDAIVANAAIASPPQLATRYGVERQFLVNHLAHFSLINSLTDLVRDGSGRIVVVSASAAVHQAPTEGIMFDNLDGGRFYDPNVFYGQSKLAAALFAKELSRRLNGRGITANSVHPGATRGTRLYQTRSLPYRVALSAAQVFMKSAAQGAATQTLLAASPLAEGITGEYWANCRIAAGNPLMSDPALARRLWQTSENVLAQHAAARRTPLREAA